MITSRQKEVLEFIGAYSNANKGVAPTFRDIRAGCGMASLNDVHRVVHALAERGWIRMLPRKRRAIELLRQPPRRVIRRVDYSPANASFYRFNELTKHLELWEPEKGGSPRR